MHRLLNKSGKALVAALYLLSEPGGYSIQSMCFLSLTGQQVLGGEGGVEFHVD